MKVEILDSTGKFFQSDDWLEYVKALGRGTQGEVHHVRDQKGNSFALKIYHPSILRKDINLEDRIRRLVGIGSPSPNFFWPIDFVEVFIPSISESAGKGYLMQLRPKSFIHPALYLNGQVSMEFASIFKVCLNLANSFAALHLKGLCYKDVSINNFFFDPESGECSVIDIDNICYDNDIDNTHTVLGTPRFMAPEIVSGNARPSIKSDNHSLAVLLFYLLLLGHPLEGKRESKIKIFDVAAQRFLYGEEAVYIFNTCDDSNRPDKDIHSPTLFMSDILPSFLMKAFDQAFCAGLHDPNLRVPEAKWIIELKRLIDQCAHCPHCGQENFIEDLALQSQKCWDCKSEYQPMFINSSGISSILRPGIEIVSADGSILGRVVRHPSDKKYLGLRNLSQTIWKSNLPNGATADVLPNKSIVLGKGMSIDTRHDSATLIEVA